MKLYIASLLFDQPGVSTHAPATFLAENNDEANRVAIQLARECFADRGHGNIDVAVTQVTPETLAEFVRDLA